MADDFFLPIRRRGNFFKDDYFSDYQSDFDSAINKVMDRYGGRSMLADQFSNYRKMRDETNDAGTAASISDTKDHYVIVLDMGDFLNGSITVSTSGRNAIVEASTSTKKFYKRYPIPLIANTDGIKSAMSDEGILTITAPKHIPKVVPLSGDFTTDAGSSDTSSPSATRGVDNPLKLDIDESTYSSNEGTHRKSSSTVRQDSTSSTPHPPTETRRLSIDRRGKFFQDPKFEHVWSDFETAMDEMIEKERKKRTQAKTERRSERDAILDKFNRRFFDDAHSSKFDDFFERDTPRFGRFQTYRNLRKWDPEDDTQAFTVKSTSNGYKILVDAKDIDSDSLSVKASGEGLVVSGGQGSNAFKRRFSLPGLANLDLVNATISEDGILTISVPFK